MQLALCAACAALVLTAACGGKAVIDAELGTGGNGAGGSGGSSSGGGGAGAASPCVGQSGLIEVFGDGVDQVYQSAGPSPDANVPTAQRFSSPMGNELVIRGCQLNTSTNECITLRIPDVAGPLETGAAVVEYTSGEGIVFIGTSGFTAVAAFGPVDGVVGGSYSVNAFASGGGEVRQLSGDFNVCRLADVNNN